MRVPEIRPVLAVVVICASVAQPVSAQNNSSEAAVSSVAMAVGVAVPNPQIPLEDSFPDGISPSHVFSKIDRLDRSLDHILKAQNVRMPTFPDEIEDGLKPMHVYQSALSCADRLQELDDLLQVFAIPTISVRPATYAPRDVLFIVTTMLQNVERIATHLKVEALPDDELIVADKTPTDVFAVSVRVLVKLNSLCGHEELKPAEVYSQMVRGVQDVRSILKQNDPACRYRIDKPDSPLNLKPGDVFAKCLQIRQLINRHRERLSMPTIPVPDVAAEIQIRPRDVFFQTQIIIAELNLLKMRLNTVSTTPLPVPVGDDTTPTDVHGQATMIEYLLNQVGGINREREPAETIGAGGAE
jgi:hypothetical protein